MMCALFPKLSFSHDETPMSWAARQAAFHTGGRLGPFLNDMEIPIADLARGKLEAVERLCSVAGQDLAPVLGNAIMAVGKRRFRLRGEEFSAEFTTGPVTRFCPLCLDEDIAGHGDPRVAMRHRLHWRIASIRTCPAHRIPLSDVRIGKWNDMAHELQAMDEAIAEEGALAAAHETREPSPLQKYVEQRLQGAAGTPWMDAQAIDQVARMAEQLGGLLAFGPAQKAADMTEDMWDVAGRTAWPLIAEGGDAIRDILVQQLKDCQRQNGHPSPRNAFGMLYGWLFASKVSKDPGLIREIVRDVIIDNVPLMPGQMLLGAPVIEPRYASIASIAKAEHLHSKTLTNVLRVAGVIDDVPPIKGARNVVADYSRAKALIETAKHAVPATHVPDLLNASRPLVAALIELNQLTRIQEHEAVKSKVGKAIDGRSVQRVTRFLECNFGVVGNVPKDHVPLAKAAEKCRVSLDVILELLFGLHLKKVSRLKGQGGFGGVLVLPSEIMAKIKDPPPDVSDEIRFWMG